MNIEVKIEHQAIAALNFILREVIGEQMSQGRLAIQMMAVSRELSQITGLTEIINENDLDFDDLEALEQQSIAVIEDLLIDVMGSEEAVAELARTNFNQMTVNMIGVIHNVLKATEDQYKYHDNYLDYKANYGVVLALNHILHAHFNEEEMTNDS